jgi:hypothetical protein
MTMELDVSWMPLGYGLTLPSDSKTPIAELIQQRAADLAVSETRDTFIAPFNPAICGWTASDRMDAVKRHAQESASHVGILSVFPFHEMTGRGMHGITQCGLYIADLRALLFHHLIAEHDGCTGNETFNVHCFYNRNNALRWIGHYTNALRSANLDSNREHRQQKNDH